MKKVFVMGSIICLLLFSCFWFFSNKTIEPNELLASGCTVNKETISLKIDMTTAAMVIKDYSLEYKNKSLYIKFKGKVFTSNRSAISTIKIKNKYKNLENIYLTNGSTNKKIWSSPLTE